MNDFEIDSTQSTPAIHGAWARGTLYMSGDSYPENSFEFFGPVIAWVERFLKNTDQPLRLELRLVYMNTSSVRAMLEILDLLEEAHTRGRTVSVRWLYDSRNERVFDLAEEFREDYHFPFEIAAEDLTT